MSISPWRLNQAGPGTQMGKNDEEWIYQDFKQKSCTSTFYYGSVENHLRQHVIFSLHRSFGRNRVLYKRKHRSVQAQAFLPQGPSLAGPTTLGWGRIQLDHLGSLGRVESGRKKSPWWLYRVGVRVVRAFPESSGELPPDSKAHTLHFEDKLVISYTYRHRIDIYIYVCIIGFCLPRITQNHPNPLILLIFQRVLLCVRLRVLSMKVVILILKILTGTKRRTREWWRCVCVA